MRRVHVLVSGYVQGVGYRYTLRAVAERHGVGGWVRNLRDGRVEAELVGPTDAVDAVLSWTHEGPPGASVTDVAVSEGTDAAPAARFEVLPTV